MRTRDFKARAEEFEDQYEDARDEAFNDEFLIEFTPIFSKQYGMNLSNIITEEDVQGFLDSFTFPDEADWCADQVQSELDDIGDQKYQEWKERDI